MVWMLAMSLACSGGTDDTATLGDTQDSAQPNDEGWVLAWASADFDEPVDQCQVPCLSVQLTHDGVPVAGVEAIAEVEGVGIFSPAITNDEGIARVCPDGLDVGEALAAVTVVTEEERLRITTGVDVRPFGWAWGLDKPVAAEDALPWVPSFVRHASNPLLEAGTTGMWDDNGVILATVVEHEDSFFMYYSGTAGVDYEIGVATSPDGIVWSKPLAEAVLTPGGEAMPWRRYATNAPFALVVDGLFRVWYTGRAGEAGDLSIGLAESADGLTFVQHGTNPVFEPSEDNADWEGSAVAHPAVTLRDGVYEMWYSTGLHRIGHAISADGVDWTRFCGGPVLIGDGGDWENDQAKSAEVIFDGERYLMNYSAGGSGEFQVGWATSTDGIRWVLAEEPVLTIGETGAWDDKSVLGAAALQVGDSLHIWYSGSTATGTAVGLATATLESK